MRRIGRCVRQRPILTVCVVVPAFVVLVPVWPYQPHCGNWASYADFRTVEGEMTPEFVEAMGISLSEERVIHVQIGDRIYLTTLSALDTAGELPLGRGGVLDAELQAVHRLLTPGYLGSYIGQELNGRIYWPPEYLAVFLDEEGWPDAEDCVFIRAVAFGEPPPPGYEPEPSFLDAAPGSD